MRTGVITGLGSALPEQVLTNKDLELSANTNDEWIVDRTGIRERRIGGMTSTLSVEAGRKALDQSGIDPAEIDLLVLATTTPDQMVPATASVVQHQLGLNCGAFDVNAACSGFTYGLVAAQGMVTIGVNNILVIGCDSLSRITDYTERNTAILFADGAGAAVLQVQEADTPAMLGWDLGSDGAAAGILYAEIGGKLVMEGREVFRRAVRVMVDSARKTMEMAGVTADEVALVVPHQANIRIIESAMNKLDLPMEKAALNLARVGNTSSASIPMALDEAVADGRVKPGDLVLLVGFGAGMTWASAMLRWDGA
ncbi:MAG: ketoacyl-ACP synthase III [Acidimicrobiales bacterium]|nr:ketoacyl-ACP synthase III [Acidimicrobiales bacterium]